MATAEDLEDQEGGGFDLPRLLGVVRRRHMAFLIPLLAGWLAVWGVSWLLPARYRSTTTILVEQPTTPKDYVLPNVNDDTQDQLVGTTQRIVTRARLLAIIQRMNLYSQFGTGTPAEDAKVDRMRKDIEIEFQHNGLGNEVTALTLSYSSASAHTAQQVASELTYLFINENLEAREKQSEDTTKFLEQQMETARKSLEEQEEKIREFKGQHVGELPTQLSSNLQILSGLQSQMQAEEDALNTAKQQRVYLETMINQYRSLQAPSSKGTGGTATRSLAAVDTQLEKLRAELADLTARYTDKHPDVRKVKEQIAREEKAREQVLASLKARPAADADADADAEQPPGAADAPDASPLAQLQGQLHANKVEIANRERTLVELKGRIAEYQARLNTEPVREQQLSDLTNGYDQSKAHYDELLKKKNDSALATNMELLQQGARFRMLDPPNLPARPDFPNHLKFCAMGLGAGLALGVLLAGVLEFLDDRIYDEKELQELLPVPVISEIPAMASTADFERERRRQWLGWATAAVVSMTILAGSAFSFLHG